MIEIKHGIRIYKKSTSFVIPEKFERLIDETIERWQKRQKRVYFYAKKKEPLPIVAIFSIGYDVSGVQAITILSPLDDFREEIFQEILSGRIHKMLGRKKNLYKTLPRFIYKEHSCESCQYWNEHELRIDDDDYMITGTCESTSSKFRNKLTNAFHLCDKHEKQ